MMVGADVFWGLSGFDEKLRVAFNDVDYCLRARQNGLLVVYTPYAVLYHHKSASRGRLHPGEDERFFRERWGKPGQYRDPYYNPNLSKTRPFTVEV
jgi:GT2 family glycosyltransferase